MNSRKSGGHPRIETLALVARGDLPWLERGGIMRHVRQCAECRHELEEFRLPLPKN